MFLPFLLMYLYNLLNCLSCDLKYLLLIPKALPRLYDVDRVGLAKMAAAKKKEINFKKREKQIDECLCELIRLQALQSQKERGTRARGLLSAPPRKKKNFTADTRWNARPLPLSNKHLCLYYKSLGVTSMIQAWLS